MAELHVLGQIVGGSHFQRKNIFCKVSAPWAVISPPSSLSLSLSLFGSRTAFSHTELSSQWGVETGQNFELVEGITEGQTQVDHPFEDEMAVWAQPLDIHFACRVSQSPLVSFFSYLGSVG